MEGLMDNNPQSEQPQEVPGVRRAAALACPCNSETPKYPHDPARRVECARSEAFTDRLMGHLQPYLQSDVAEETRPAHEKLQRIRDTITNQPPGRAVVELIRDILHEDTP